MTPLMICCYADVRVFNDTDLFDQVFQTIPWQKRRERIRRCRFRKDQLLSLGADYLLLRFLREKAHLSPEDLELAEGPHGKPFLPGHPRIHFNLSHSGNYAALAAGSRPCGIDVEKARTNFNRIAERFFTEEENRILSSLQTDSARSEAFLRIWTRKESYLKWSGEGLSRDLRSFQVLPEAPEDAFFYEHALPSHLITVCLPKEAVQSDLVLNGFEDWTAPHPSGS